MKDHLSLIDDELIRTLNLKGESRQLNVQWFGGKSAKEHTKVVSLQISAAGKPKRHGLKNVYGVANLNLPMQSLRQEDVQAVKANTRLPVMPYNNATPRILIGLDHAHLGVPFRTKSYGSGGPFAADTALGWVVYGPVNGKPSSPLLSSCLLAVPQDDLLEKMVSDYFETENIGAKPVQTVAAGRVDLEPSVGDSGDARALSTLEKTTKRVGQRYETVLLWKDDEVRLPESYSMALRRFVNIERKMKRDVDFASAYIRIMDDYVKKGYARRLPHFGVENPNKPGKIRLVFDAAAKVDGVSLNSTLLKGPQRYMPLPAVLFHFREGAVGVCADIKEMFHQVLMEPKDICPQRFLWRDEDEMAVMTFGAACSPCSADYVKTVNALRYSSTDPRGSRAACPSTNTTTWMTTSKVSPARTKLSPSRHGSASVVRALNPLEPIASVGWTEAEEKVLGMYWQPATDEFKFGVKYHRVPRNRGVNWDEPLPDELAAAFEDWRQGMSRIQEFRCPRHYFGGGRVRTLQLHIFVDSSQSAFAAAAYWRAMYENGDVQAHFISSKTKCAPMRTMSFPRLELQAAVLGTRLMVIVKQEHGVAISSCALWTDSKTVLHWISNTHRRYKQFVGNRVAEILESTEASQWRWIPSAENVADDATRPRKAVDLSIGSRWLSGPPFLREPEESWPRSSEVWIPSTTDDEEMKCEFALGTVNFISLQRFSSYNRLVRTTAWALRFVRRCRGIRRDEEVYGLTAMECAEAERALIRQSQREAFAEDSQGNVAKDSRLHGLSPYLDEDGVLGASGRIDDATCVPYNAHRPIILSYEEALAEMIEQQNHEKMCHQNTEATIGSIRSKTSHREEVGGTVYVPDHEGYPLEDGSRFVHRLLHNRHEELQEPPWTSDQDKERQWEADREAKRFSEVFEPAQIQGELSSKGVEWIFNCPANPAEAGAWERMVQCVKKVLAHTMKELAPKEHVLENLLIEAESIVNSRPLTHLPVTVDQEAPLTPNDLLKGASDIPDLPKDDGQEPVRSATRKQWRIARMMRDRFWKRWVHEYLPTLVRREKWCKRVEPIRRGDLVFICDPAIPRREWKRGVVEEVFTGKDRVPRRAAVRTTDRAKTMRPASKLAILDVVNAAASRGWGCRGTD
ncbi:uncharacterized protein LOC122818557 [Drosophila biarmipes]|uniref:uncharacterized protein LOC122818556 n=1 Tax=Drosophila biarmipes TaxID=125945 RepID=UPI001CDAB42D|nr:uncharacterized protein LOC122818556 [Drosophila biarmipes]XP_043948702.1 uncharacterized protein LOC122818557 [Drosophila biarmipes]